VSAIEKGWSPVWRNWEGSGRAIDVGDFRC